MTARFVPPTNKELGIEAIFEKRHLNLALFKFLVGAGQKDAPIAQALSKDYYDRMGIELHVTSRTVKGYRKLLEIKEAPHA